LNHAFDPTSSRRRGRGTVALALALLLGPSCVVRSIGPDPGLTPDKAIARIIAYEREQADGLFAAQIAADGESFTHGSILSVDSSAGASIGLLQTGTYHGNAWILKRFRYAELPDFDVYLWKPWASVLLLGLIGPSRCIVQEHGGSAFGLVELNRWYLEKTGWLSFVPVWLLGLPGLWYDTSEIEYLRALAYMKSRAH
jgi:hypothetical protein